MKVLTFILSYNFVNDRASEDELAQSWSKPDKHLEEASGKSAAVWDGVNSVATAARESVVPVAEPALARSKRNLLTDLIAPHMQW